MSRDVTRICINLRKKKRKPKLRWDIGPVSEQSLPGPVLGAALMLTLTDTQQAVVAVKAQDKKGQPTVVDAVTFSSSDETVLTVVPAGDGQSATIVAGVPGTAQVTVSADADLGDGVKTITGTLDVQVLAGEAVSLGVSTEAPTEQP